MKKILVTGGTGFIGRKVCDTLHNKDYDVNVVSRNPEKAKTKLEAVGEIYGWNPESEQLPTEAISEAEAVIHLAGETIAGRWNTEKKTENTGQSCSIYPKSCCILC